MTDALRLRQVLGNFLSNAVKFTAVGGIAVEVRVLDDGAQAQTVEVAVSDTGIGIDPEQQATAVRRVRVGEQVLVNAVLAVTGDADDH